MFHLAPVSYNGWDNQCGINVHTCSLVKIIPQSVNLCCLGMILEQASVFLYLLFLKQFATNTQPKALKAITNENSSFLDLL